jgi:hypothetical protein
MERPAHLWKPGQSGNPKGRPKKRFIDDYLRERLAAKRGTAARALVERLIAAGLDGDVSAHKLIYERTCGRPKTAEEIAIGNNPEAMTLEQVRRRLAELLLLPEVRAQLQALLTAAKPETDAIQ